MGGGVEVPAMTRFPTSVSRVQCRIFQKEGMIERLEGLLVSLDEMKYSFTCSYSDQQDLPAGRTGAVPCDDFINAITRSQLLPLRLSQFLRDQRNNQVVFLLGVP